MADELRTYPIPFRRGDVIVDGCVQFPRVMSEDDWSFLMNLLAVMKPGIVNDGRMPATSAIGEVIEQRRGPDDTVHLTVAIPVASDAVEFGTLVRIPTQPEPEERA